MGILSSKKDNELVLVFHIGSSYVAGSFFKTSENGGPEIVLFENEPVKLSESLDANLFLKETLKSLELVAINIYKARLGAPDRIFCVLASPWHISQSRLISMKKNTDFVFNDKLADDLIKKEIKLFEEENSKNNPFFKSLVRTIELKNIKILLNGYEVSEPLNKKTKELEMDVFVSFSDEEILNTIEKVIAKYFRTKSIRPIRFASSLLANFTVIRDIDTKQGNFLLINIDGETTDISMVKKNILRESVSFPYGKNQIVRMLASRLSYDLDKVDSLLSLLNDGHAEKSIGEKITPIMNDIRKEWLKDFQATLANLSHDISIPASIYLSVDPLLLAFFIETIKTEQFNQYTLAESKFEIIPVDIKFVDDFAVFPKDDKSLNSGVVLDVVYINRCLVKV